MSFCLFTNLSPIKAPDLCSEILVYDLPLFVIVFGNQTASSCKTVIQTLGFASPALTGVAFIERIDC